MNFHHLLLAAALFLSAFVSISAAHSVASDDPWTAVPGILARIKAPVFPDRDFVVTDVKFGAKLGGTHDNTAAIAKAIAACHAAGGGRVVVPAGLFLTGAIHLKSNVNLHVSEGATLLFSSDPTAYLPVVFMRWEGIECMNYSPLIYAFEQENIAITGKGTLDGGASLDNWWGWTKHGNSKRPPGTPAPTGASTRRLGVMSDNNTPVTERIFGDGYHLRPPFVQPNRCKNILIEDVTIVRSPFWELNPVLCENITVRGVQISSHGPNNDGCDPDSCRDVLIENCFFDTGDDCIAIKSGRNEDGRRVNVPSENLIIRNCVMKDGHGGVVIGSEVAAGCRNVFVENCVMDSPNLNRALRFKSNARRGGVVENVHMRNVTIGQVDETILSIDFTYQEGADGPYAPAVRNVSLENVTGKKSPRVLRIVGFKGAIADDIRFKNCVFEGIASSEQLEHAGRISFDNVTIIPAKKPRPQNAGAASE
ncbi:glycoside hydrolase family 28 protein [Termitidicoccus mucosus]|uniref:Glycoside hydrolase n=1 Tax=Termitidicoccus mucosus TaxID=1184151 RepID=A0A178IM66_9BACT|nr:glycoside hydrolase [Opitutaceae bacterium TSB47]